MQPSEIIIQDSQRNGVDGQQILRGVAAHVKNGTAKILHNNNSVLTMQHMGKQPNSYSLHLFTMDSPLGLAKALAAFVKAIRNMNGIQSVYGDTDNQQLLGLLKHLGVDVQNSDLEGYTWMAKV
jgi:hypothetical protein